MNRPRNGDIIVTCAAVLNGKCKNEECRFSKGIWDNHLTSSKLNNEDYMEPYNNCRIRAHWRELACVIEPDVLMEQKAAQEALVSFDDYITIDQTRDVHENIDGPDEDGVYTVRPGTVTSSIWRMHGTPETLRTSRVTLEEYLAQQSREPREQSEDTTRRAIEAYRRSAVASAAQASRDRERRIPEPPQPSEETLERARRAYARYATSRNWSERASTYAFIGEDTSNDS